MSEAKDVQLFLLDVQLSFPSPSPISDSYLRKLGWLVVFGVLLVAVNGDLLSDETAEEIEELLDP